MRNEVYRDDWGIPHLRAPGIRQLAHAQGRNAALDRAWQIEVERHRAQGTTAAFLGTDAVEWDRFARRVRLDDTARRCFERLECAAPRTADWVRSYVDGVNAGLTEGADRAPEFAAVGLAPGTWRPWTPLGVWLSTHILFAGFPTKLWREEVARRLGDEAIELFATDGPGTSGSNGWLVTPERTATGAPIIAGDPHRFIEDPGVYQQIRLACPEFDVVGLAVPGVPGLAHFGHTGHVAWAITNAMADYQDLYRERLRRTPAGDVEALGPDGWEPAAAHTETIDVAGADAVTVEVVETCRGPVIIGGPDTGEEAVSLRHPPRFTGELGFDALPAMLRSRTVAELDTALDRWVEPVNVVLAADTAGATLHRVAGHVPVRPRENRLRTVPAWDAAHTWRDRRAPMPRADVLGAAVMANQREIAAPARHRVRTPAPGRPDTGTARQIGPLDRQGHGEHPHGHPSRLRPPPVGAAGRGVGARPAGRTAARTAAALGPADGRRQHGRHAVRGAACGGRAPAGRPPGARSAERVGALGSVPGSLPPLARDGAEDRVRAGGAADGDRRTADARGTAGGGRGRRGAGRG
ncbi:hypothetical protein GCM10018966_084740 [Streptomyces yanii]